MRSVISVFLFSMLFISGRAQNFGGNPASVKWYQINTDRVRVIFPTGSDSQANRIANVMKLLGDSTAKTIDGSQKKLNNILSNIF